MTRIAAFFAAVAFALAAGHTITKTMANVIAYNVERASQ